MATDDVPRGPKGKRRYAMDYISDPDLFKAVMFACSMIRKGTYPGTAFSRAAGYYNVDYEDVAKYVGQRGGTYAHRRRRS